MGNQQSEKCQKYQTDEDINEEGTITTDADVHPKERFNNSTKITFTE
jgi:hypothetical protein